MKLTSTLNMSFNALLLALLSLVANYSSAQSPSQCIYFKKIASGNTSTHCVAIAKDGTLWAWGYNQFYQVGNNSNINVSKPLQLSAATGWKDVAAGTQHSLAVDAQGKLWGWGINYNGELGDGQASGITVPAPTRIHSADSIWKSISASGSHSGGITADGKLWIWGYNTYWGSYGTINYTPLQVGADTDWAAVSVGYNQVIAIKRDSTLWGFGRNGEGQAGDSTTLDNIYIPGVRIDSNHRWVAVSAGNDHCLALQKDGSLWSWGGNHWGQLGNGNTTDGTKGPKRVGTGKYIAIAAGGHFSVAISKDSMRWVWGDNSLGQFGNDIGGSNGTHESWVPILSDSSKHWAKVTAAANASYNITSDGTGWAAGDNGSLEIGDGNDIRTNTLIKVGTPYPYPALATNGSSATEYQRGYSYYATNCSNLITLIYKTGANPLHNLTTSKVWVDAAVNTDAAGKPYVQRHYVIKPANSDTTATATVVLFFTQAEFDAYNASPNVVNGTYPKLPLDGNDANGYRNNLRVIRILAETSDGSGKLNSYHGTSVLITPSSVVYASGFWQVTFDVTGLGGFFATTGSNLLPVTWLNVNATYSSKNQVTISWKVNEINTAGYTVEKSNGSSIFSAVGNVAAKAAGVNTYQYTDDLVAPGQLFYRVKQRDKDGRSTYSKIILLHSVASTAAVSIYPNPVTDYINITGLQQNIIYTINITDIEGKTMAIKYVTNAQNQVVTNNLASGLYFIKITAPNYVTVFKFIKQ